MKRAWLCLLTIILLSINSLPCYAWLVPYNPGGFTLEFSGENNLFPLDVTMKTLGKELPMELDIPAAYFSRNGLFLSLPLWQRESAFLGIFYQRTGLIRATGDTLQFYRCYANPKLPHENKYYDLAGDYLKYTLFGSYLSKEWRQGNFRVTLGSTISACFDYEKLSVQGQGWVGGENQFGIYGNYRQEWSAPEDPWGWGLAVNSNFFYQQDGLSLQLTLQNFPAWYYFPQLRQENGRVDTERDSIGPLPIKGFKTEGAEIRNLSPTVRLQAACKAKNGGMFSGTVVYNGYVPDLCFGYRQPIGKAGLIAMVNPVYWNYSFGLDSQYAGLRLIFGLERPGTLRGLSFKLQF